MLVSVGSLQHIQEILHYACIDFLTIILDFESPSMNMWEYLTQHEHQPRQLYSCCILPGKLKIQDQAHVIKMFSNNPTFVYVFKNSKYVNKKS